MPLLLLAIFSIWSQDVWNHYDIGKYCSFECPQVMELSIDEALTSVGELTIATYRSSAKDLGIEYSFSHYTYPSEVLDVLDEFPDLVDSLLLSIPDNIAIQNGTSVEYASIETFGGIPSVAFRIKLNDAYFQKGRAILLVDKMIIQQVSADARQLLSQAAKKYFKSLHLKEL